MKTENEFKYVQIEINFHCKRKLMLSKRKTRGCEEQFFLVKNYFTQTASQTDHTLYFDFVTTACI